METILSFPQTSNKSNQAFNKFQTETSKYTTLNFLKRRTIQRKLLFPFLGNSVAIQGTILFNIYIILKKDHIPHNQGLVAVDRRMMAKETEPQSISL